MTLHYSRLNLPFLETHTIQANIPCSIVTASFFPISLCSRIIQLFILAYNSLPSVPVGISDDLWQSTSLKLAKVHFSRGRTANPPRPPSQPERWLGKGHSELIPCVSLMRSDISTGDSFTLQTTCWRVCFNLIKAPHPELLSSPRPPCWELMLPTPQAERSRN